MKNTRNNVKMYEEIKQYHTEFLLIKNMNIHILV